MAADKADAARVPCPYGKPLNRRRFFRRLTGVAALSVGAGWAGWWLGRRGRADGPLLGAPLDREAYCRGLDPGGPRLAIVHGKVSPERLVREALYRMGGMGRFVRPGEVVLVKPNAAFDRPPMLGATTCPEVVGAVVRLCRQAGAARVLVVDNPIHRPETAFHNSGIGPAVAAAGGELILPAPSDFARLPVPGARILDAWEILAGPLRRAQRVIGVAPVKDHNLCGASMGLKNWYGLLGGPRQQLHQEIHEVIADFLELLRPTLTILDGTRVLMTHGPTGGSPGDVRRADLVAAATDPVAVDAFGWTLLRRPGPLPTYLELARARGRGVTDWESLDPVRLELEEE